jgi:ribosomal protein S18 acetylase RimI-like enzyme
MSATPVIREARPDDLEAVAALCRAHAGFERAAPPVEGLAKQLAEMFFGQPPRASCLVVESGGVLVGYATWSLEFSTWRAAEYAHVDCLYLGAAARGQGIGRSLMEAMARYAAAQGATHLEWQTPEWNESAARFYESLGARSTGKLRFMWLPPGC